MSVRVGGKRGLVDAEPAPHRPEGTADPFREGCRQGSYWSDGLKQPNSGWSTPVALRALVRDGQIAEWQVYADNEPIRQQMRAV